MAYAPFDLTGRTVLVTGGNRGIGLGMAEALVQAGAGVVIWGSNADNNAKAEAQLKSLQGKGPLLTQVCDVSDEAAVDARLAEAVAAVGPLYGCIANAGISGAAKSFMEMSTAEWRRMMSVNLDGAFYTLRAATRHMVEAGQGGSLISMASTAAIEGAARSEHYGATKGGLLSMTRALAVELARYRIRANSILPGWIETDMTERLTSHDKFAGNVMPRIPARRWGKPSDFGGIGVYLMSDAAAYHTGDHFVIDGGYTIF
ncbi:MAG: SDR family NAD(P)-dependent oxidoreductase [Sneathiellaceae bacterium]